MVGSSPRHFLTDLAEDTSFKGKLVVDVTEGLFFNKADAKPDAGIAYYKKRTPAQKVSFWLDKPVESQLAFLNEGSYSLNALLDQIHLKNREGARPPLDFPPGFHRTLFSRQNKMTPDFVADTNQQNQVKAIWASLGKNPMPPLSEKALDSVMQSVKRDVDKINARGGVVIFVRTPSSGRFFMAEKKNYPRNVYWDRLLTLTRCSGIYFGDYPVLAKLVCPEFSHLNPQDAVTYTTKLVSILQKEKGWNFNTAGNSLVFNSK